MGASPREGTSKPAKHSLPNSHPHRLDIGVGEHRLAETHGLLASLRRLEYAVDHTTVKMEVLVERRSETMHKAHRPQSCLGCGAGGSLAQYLFDHTQEGIFGICIPKNSRK